MLGRVGGDDFFVLLPGMAARGWGRVIAISSIAGLRGLKGAAAYSASSSPPMP